MTIEATGNPAPAGFPGVWAIAGTPVEERYPCRCHERKGKECVPAWCPCVGRPDPLPAPCCSSRFTAEDHVEGQRAWRIAKLEREARDLGRGGS